MNRRQFAKTLAGTTGALLAAPAPEVKRVLVMFKCHFDAGFIDTQKAVVTKYFEHYFPQAISVAAEVRQSGKGDRRYTWTTGSWLLYEYLEQANAPDRKRMEAAIARGDIAWHALPFSWQTEMFDRSAIEGCLALSKTLDQRFGTHTTGAKMTDVPGHSRGLIAPLAAHGVTLLDIGVNSASTPPDVPPVFNWKDLSGASLSVIYHRHDYGGTVQIPASDLAISVEVRNDNSGPHTLSEIDVIYRNLAARFPNAAIRSSNLAEIAHAVSPFASHLPAVTDEIGDTWIYGVASDPLKVAHFRELLRLRQEWISAGSLQIGDATDMNFLRRWALGAEHTWGTDTKTWLDFDHYTPQALSQELALSNYRTVEASWVEKRDDISAALPALPTKLREKAEQRLAALKPSLPKTENLRPAAVRDPIETKHFSLQFDGSTGALIRLENKQSGRNWASPDHPCGLFSYQTLSSQDYERFLSSYITSKADWAPKDFGKPNIEKFGAKSRAWSPKIVEAWSGRQSDAHLFRAHLQIEDTDAEQSGVVAWPADLYLDLTLPDAEPVIELELSWFGKKANRLPEAMWFTFQPDAPQIHNWQLDKVNTWISPFDIISGGNRHQHAVGRGMRYSDQRGTLFVETLDAPFVALGEKSPIHFSNTQPDLSKGIHFGLFNNAWGTNYVQWFAEDMKFRFRIRA